MKNIAIKKEWIGEIAKLTTEDKGELLMWLLLFDIEKISNTTLSVNMSSQYFFIV